MMLIDEILEQIDGGGLSGFFAFETFVLHVLKHHLNGQGKALLTDMSTFQVGDAIAPAGFDNFQGPVLFEVKFNLGKVTVRALLDFLKRLSASITEPEARIKTVIFVSAKALNPRAQEKFLELLDPKSHEFDVKIWGPAEVNALVETYPAKANEIAKNLFALRLESATNKPKVEWKAERESIVAKLAELYRAGQFSLFLGAGVSSSAGMPDWNKLLNSLFVTYLSQDLDPNDSINDAAISELVARLNAVDEPSSLMAARYLRKGLTQPGSDKKGFVKAVTTGLYGQRNPAFPLNSALIISIANLCMPRRTGAKVRSVVTYNFDDLLERQLLEKSIIHKCVYTQNETYDLDELPVYHVHGFIPENDAQYEKLDTSTLVFSEEGYHQIYADAYHWSNLVQLNSLRENNCLMVGLSMTDPNLRRLLEIAARNIERSKHFAFIKRLTEERFCFETNSITGERVPVVGNLSSAREFLERHHLLNEELMKELGVTIIWFEHYDDIPEILRRIADS